MPTDEETATERTALLHPVANGNHLSLPQRQREHDAEAQSIVTSVVTKEEQQMGDSTVGERLPYNDYSTIDWLHDLVCLEFWYCFECVEGLDSVFSTDYNLFDDLTTGQESLGWIWKSD
jgi:hypothetical protein